MKFNNDSRRVFLQKIIWSTAFFTDHSFRFLNEIKSENFKSNTLDDPYSKVLFSFDDYNIPWHHNMKLTLVEATKHPENPVLKKGSKGSPDYGHAILYGTVIKERDKFRMWYLGMFEPELDNGQAPGNWRPMCYAESYDGINWEKPNLGLVEFNGNKNNNICLIEGSPNSLTRINDFLSILYEPYESNPSHRYKAAYIAHVPYEDIKGGLSNIGNQEKTPCVTICATSADGLSWKVVGDRPANSDGERFEVSGLYKFGDFYYSTGQLLSPWAWMPDGSNCGRVMLTYRSSDFFQWSKAKAFSFARPGQKTSPPIHGQQTHMGAGMWNRNNVLVGLYGMWQDGIQPDERPKGASHLYGTHVDLGLIISNDGIHYREPIPDFKIIPRGKFGEWDDTALLQGHTFVNEGEKTMIWYSHWDTSGNLKSMEIGLATLRRDGFGFLSLKESDQEGHFITTSFEFSDRKKLLINVDGVSIESPIKIELLDHLDRALSGYSGRDITSITSNGTKVQISWQNKIYLPVKKKFAVKVSFTPNSNAKVYALYMA